MAPPEKNLVKSMVYVQNPQQFVFRKHLIFDCYLVAAPERFEGSCHLQVGDIGGLIRFKLVLRTDDRRNANLCDNYPLWTKFQCCHHKNLFKYQTITVSIPYFLGFYCCLVISTSSCWLEVDYHTHSHILIHIKISSLQRFWTSFLREFTIGIRYMITLIVRYSR